MVRNQELALFMLTALAATASYGREALYGYATEESVKEACGANLKSNDGAFGCIVEQNGETLDYRCNNNTKNGSVGCRVLFRGTNKPATGTRDHSGR
jgi:hypothetical protein